MNGNVSDTTTIVDPEAFIDGVVEIDGDRFERLQPITDYRRDPGEGRILFLCKSIGGHGNADIKGGTDDAMVMKVKIQVPPRAASDDPREPLPGPSDTTAAEWTALQLFRDKNVNGVPHLVAKNCMPQNEHGPWPGGHISYTVMTLMPGQDLIATKFWSLDDEMKDEIRQAFLTLLKNIWRLGIAPYDCALRNIMWDSQMRRCSIVDFEHYRPAKDPINMNEREEMQQWGIVQRQAASHWAVEWGLIKEINRY